MLVLHPHPDTQRPQNSLTGGPGEPPHQRVPSTFLHRSSPHTGLRDVNTYPGSIVQVTPHNKRFFSNTAGRDSQMLHTSFVEKTSEIRIVFEIVPAGSLHGTVLSLQL